MGNSRPPAALIDLVESFARRRDGRVEIVLVGPEAAIGSNPFVMLRQGERRVKAPARLVEDEQGRRVVATLPAVRNLWGTWALRLKSDSEPSVRIQARLLVQGPRRPVVLLWGARGGESRLPVPSPRRTREGRSARTARKVTHRALSLLPERHAEQARGQIRRLLS
ncbi:MAG: hypothetical protein L0H93_11345 [Nocardioides sp.]|nr:hypothetical protein [Nocardioides sp.]